MNKEIILIANALAVEKGVPRDVIFKAMEDALASVSIKKINAADNADVKVSIHPETGEYTIHRNWEVIEDTEEITDPALQLTLSDAKKIDKTASIDSKIEEPLKINMLGRIAAQQAKHIISRVVKEAERAKLIAKYNHKVHELITGKVKKTTREYIIIEITDEVDGILNKDEIIPRESYHLNDRVRSYIKAIDSETKGPFVILSRTAPELLIELFKLEVPEISEGVIEIKATARDPGQRSKIAVKTNDKRIDPIGACVGMRGTRVQAVSNELNNERIDIINWSDDPAQMVINSLAPAEISSIVVDDENQTMNLVVPEDQLAQAIGRNGQNIKLAKQLSGWQLNISSNEETNELHKEPKENLKKEIATSLDVDENIADILIRENYNSIKKIAHATAQDLIKIDEFDIEIAEEVLMRAKNALLSITLLEGDEEEDKIKGDLNKLPDLTNTNIEKLNDNGIINLNDLAELDTDELCSIIDINEDLAGKLIMKAREPWFKNDES